jgi:hypothetical protein
VAEQKVCFAIFVHNNGTLTQSTVLYVVAGTSFNEFRALQAMTDFMNEHHDAMISAPNSKDYIAKHIMPALMEVGVCEYNATTREFHRCQYREAELKVLQKSGIGRSTCAAYRGRMWQGCYHDRLASGPDRA